MGQTAVLVGNSDGIGLAMSAEKAVDHLEVCIQKKPMRYSAPKIAIPLLKLRRLMMALGFT